MEIKILRIFNTYSPRMLPNDGRVVSNFIVQALRGEDIMIYGESLQTRSFCYVDDMVDAIIHMMSSPKGFTGPVNAVNLDEVTILRLAKKIIELTESPSKIIFSDLPGDDPRRRKPDISLTRKELGWNPVTNLEAGLVKTIEYFRECLRA